MRMITDDQIFALLKGLEEHLNIFIRCFFRVLAKKRENGMYTFFLTCPAAECELPYIIKVIARNMEKSYRIDWDTKYNYLKRNLGISVPQIDYIF